MKKSAGFPGIAATGCLITLAAFALLFSAGCGGKHRYPDPYPGWHAADYSVVFGRLQRIPGKSAEDPPFWVILYGFPKTDNYTGKLNLMPPEKLIGYRGGELVELRGQLNTGYQHPDIGGTWYNVQAIRLWNGQLPQ